jgi:TatD DNase family protein
VIDSHTHVDDGAFDADREAVIERALAAGVTRMLAIGSGDGPPDGLRAAIELAERYPCFLATVGVHPHKAGAATDETFRNLFELVQHPKVVGFGEIGLDFHYNFSPPEVQREVFVRQLAIAREARLPVIIHTREAWDDTYAILRKHWTPELGGVFHCFSGGPHEVEQVVRLGFHLGYGGVVTFPKATNVQEGAAMAPAERILLETDCPYLAPVPHRGKRNEPAYVSEVARRLAALRDTTPEAVSRLTTENFNRLFQVDQGTLGDSPNRTSL